MGDIRIFGNYFYNQRIRKSVAVFGSLFNDIHVIRKDNTGKSLSQIKVPLSYAPKRDFLSRIAEMESGEDNERKIALKLPRLSFEIIGMNYDATRQLPKMNNCAVTSSSGELSQLFTPVPYAIQFQLNVYSKTNDDALQIIEQILPYFTPQYTVTVKPLDEFDTITEDTPINLTGITFSDDYESPLESRRTITYTLDFEMKISLYKDPNANRKIITQADIDVFNIDTNNIITTISVDSAG